MASRMIEILKTRGGHEVGNLNNWTVSTLNQGALVDDDVIENFTVVELGFNSKGQRICKQLRDVKNESYLIAAVERRLESEDLDDFYNAKGERARIVYFEKGKRFDTSAFKLNTGATEVKNGMIAHFDPTSKKYIISLASTPHADYANANKKFIVAEVENVPRLAAKTLIRLEIQ